jgi:hypothetical protein
MQFPDAPVTYVPAAGATATNQTNLNGSDAASTPAPQFTALTQNNAPKPSDAAAQNDSALLQPKSSALTNQSGTAPVPGSMDVATALKNIVSPSTVVSGATSNSKQDVSLSQVAEQLTPKNAGSDAALKPSEPATSVVELSLAPNKSEMRVGEKRQFGVELKSDAPLGLAVVTMRFDPRVIKINNVSAGKIFANAKTAPALTQSMDQNGMVLVSLAPAAGSPAIGEGTLLNLDIEATGAGDSGLVFDLSNVHLVAADGRPTVLQLGLGGLTVKAPDSPAPAAPKPNSEDINGLQPKSGIKPEGIAMSTFRQAGLGGLQVVRPALSLLLLVP